jgi:flagellar FliL protein
MADKATSADGHSAHDAAGSRSPWIRRVKIGGFLLIVVLVECAVAAMFIPSADQTAAMGHAPAAAPASSESHGSGEMVDPEKTVNVEKHEIDLGEFGVTSFQPATNTALRIDLHLFATVLVADEAETHKLLEENQHRFRDQVLVILRSAEMSDLTDAGLGLIKRRILEKTNRTLGKHLIQEVVISDFSFIEQ